MPKNLPTAAQLWEGDVSFFSIDTNLIQAAGYSFEKGALHQLPRQLPPSMSLQLPEVVAQEIVKHRMQSVHQAEQHIRSASAQLKRLTGAKLEPMDQALDELNLAETASQRFLDEVHKYAVRCRGAVLPIAGAMAASDLFLAYFAEKPPFGQRKDKKSEFPDAMCLWLLERYAADNNTKGIVASQDDGWRLFAEASERLYIVKSIDELAVLFAATSEHAKAIKDKIELTVNDPTSTLRANLAEALNRHVGESDWDTSEVFSSSGRVQAESYNAEVVSYAIDGELNIWPVSDEPTTWVIEFTASVAVNVYLSVEFFVWDSIDDEELSMGFEDVVTQQDVEVDVFLTSGNVHLDVSPNDWEIDIEIARGRYSIEGFEVERDYGRDE